MKKLPKRKLCTALLFLLLAAVPALAQENFPSGISKFAARATETTEVSLDKSMLDFAGRFLSSRPQEQTARRIISGLQGIYVRSYDFKAPGAYTPAEVEALRQQFPSPAWSHIISVRSKDSDGDTDVYMHVQDGRVKGMSIICAEPTELTFVSIVGQLKPEDIRELSGQFGIPKIHSQDAAPAKGGSQ